MSWGRLSTLAWQQARNFGTKPAFVSDVGSRVAASFSKDPAAATQQIIQSLQPAERVILMEALNADAKALANSAQSSVRHAQFTCPLHNIQILMDDESLQWVPEICILLLQCQKEALACTHQITDNFSWDRSQAHDSSVPQSAVLFSVALSTGLPFIVFGFSDNAIMVS